MLSDPKIFREYDIRGIFAEDFDGELAWRLGYYLGNQFGQVAVCIDQRESSQVLKAALLEGLARTGASVVDLGLGPTPYLYFACKNSEIPAGVQITASHNPENWNGFKLMIKGETPSGTSIKQLGKELESLKEENRCEKKAKQAHKLETLQYDRARYLDFLASYFLPRLGPNLPTIAIDSLGGSAGGFVLELFKKLGVRVFEVKGNNTLNPCKIKNLEPLHKLVLSEKADLGLAFDGDGDRLVVLDEQGGMIAGDLLLVLLAREFLEESAPVIVDIKCSSLVARELESLGARAITSPSGHAPIKARMLSENAALGGELTGHYFFGQDYYSYDDALFAAGLVVASLSNSDVPLSTFQKTLPKTYITPELRLSLEGALAESLLKKVREEFSEQELSLIDGVKVFFEQGWALVRASNTEPVLSLRFEAETGELLENYQKKVLSILELPYGL